MEIRKVCERYLLVLGELDMVYEQRAREVAVAQGRLNNIRNITFIYLSHLLVDILLPIKIVNKCQQRKSILICEFKSSINGVISYLNKLQDPQLQGKSEKSFWEAFNLQKMMYIVRGYEIDVASKKKTRERKIKGKEEKGQSDDDEKIKEETKKQDLLKSLATLRKGLVSAFLADFQRYNITDDWQIFDILSLPEGKMVKYGVQEIKNLYLKYSAPTKYLEVEDRKDGKDRSLVTTSGCLLEEDLELAIVTGNASFYVI
jgi:hypothetical protein